MTTTPQRMEDTSKRTTLWYDLVLDDEVPLAEPVRERVPVPAEEQQSAGAPLHQPRVAPARARAPVAQGVADGLPGRAHPRGRQLPRLRDCRATPTSWCAPATASRPTSTPACTAGARSRTTTAAAASSAAASTASPGGWTARCATRPRRPSSPRSRPTATRGGLPEARVGLWGGFVFISPDPNGVPLEEFLGDLPEHFARWDFEHRYVQAHVSKKIRCNWKVAQEAFYEGLHLGATHPQSAPYVGDANSAVDVYGNYGAPDQPVRHADRGSPARSHRGRHPEADAGHPRG